jgi:hypothetical protein
LLAQKLHECIVVNRRQVDVRWARIDGQEDHMMRLNEFGLASHGLFKGKQYEQTPCAIELPESCTVLYDEGTGEQTVPNIARRRHHRADDKCENVVDIS